MAFQGGSFFGAGLQYPITLKIGRKWTIILSNVLFIASGFMQVFANGSLDLMSEFEALIKFFSLKFEYL